SRFARSAEPRGSTAPRFTYHRRVGSTAGGLGMRAACAIGAFLFALSNASPAQAQLGGLLDRVKRKADEAAAEVRDARRGVESATDVHGRAEREVDGALADVERAVPTEEKLERRAEQAIETTEPVQGLRAAEREAHDVATADERAAAAARAEVRRTERDIERATDVEGRARTAAERTAPAVAAREAERDVRQAERDVRDVTEADDRARRGVEQEVGDLERAVDNLRDALN